MTDRAGKPTAAALGVIIVDEAVYALQEMQPGLEKVYFTSGRAAQAAGPGGPAAGASTLPPLVRQPVLAAPQQQVAQVLLTAVQPPLPARWEVTPAVERQQKLDGQIPQLGWALFQYAHMDREHAFMPTTNRPGSWAFKPRPARGRGQGGHDLDPAVHDRSARQQADAGQAWPKLEKDFTRRPSGPSADHATACRSCSRRAGQLRQPATGEWFKDGNWNFPATVLSDAVRQEPADMQPTLLKDAWGQPIQLVKRDKPWNHPDGWTQFDHYELVSAGPDGKFGTADDVKRCRRPDILCANGLWWTQIRYEAAQLVQGLGRGGRLGRCARSAPVRFRLVAIAGAHAAVEWAGSDGTGRVPMPPMGAVARQGHERR